MNNRDKRFDALKAIAIGMVVVGHVFSMSDIKTCINQYLGTFIVGCNMPLFFIISGYFSKSSVSSFRMVFRRCFHYLWAMGAFSFFLALMWYALGQYPSISFMVKRVVSIPIFGWWFMWSLMLSIVCVATYVFVKEKIRLRRFSCALMLLAVYVAILAVPDSIWQMKYFKFCLPFYFLGYVLRGCNLDGVVKSRTTLYIWVVSLMIYFAYVVVGDAKRLGFYWANLNLVDIVGTCGSVCAFITRYLVSAAGVFAIAWPILNVRVNLIPTWVAELGMSTMGVYFLHQSFIKHLIMPCMGSCGVLNLFLISIVVWLSCHVLVCYIKCHRLLRHIFFFEG